MIDVALTICAFLFGCLSMIIGVVLIDAIKDGFNGFKREMIEMDKERKRLAALKADIVRIKKDSEQGRKDFLVLALVGAIAMVLVV